MMRVLFVDKEKGGEALFDMPYPELLPEARALLERRCSFVRITFGPDNRAQADWEALRAILEAEEHEFEMTFPDAFYVGTT